MPGWYTVKFLEQESLTEIADAIECGFGGMCTAYRGDDPRVVYVSPTEEAEGFFEKQLQQFVTSGYLLSFAKRT